jgi:hypothetical protein
MKDMRMLSNRNEYSDDMTLVILSISPNCVIAACSAFGAYPRSHQDRAG